MKSNEKTDPAYWNKRVIEADGNELKLVYESAQHFNACQRVGETMIKAFVNEGDTVLDVGCGFGRFYPMINAIGATYLGIDFSEEMVREARERNPHGDFKIADWRTFLGKYDVVFECICLSSFSGKLKEFQDVLLRRFVREGGTLIMVEPECCLAVPKNTNLFG